MNWVDAAGCCLQLRQSLEPAPLLMSWLQRVSAWTPGVDATFANVELPPLLQKNGSHCQVVSSAASQVKAIPKCAEVVSALASVTSCAHVVGGLRCAAFNIAMLYISAI